MTVPPRGGTLLFQMLRLAPLAAQAIYQAPWDITGSTARASVPPRTACARGKEVTVDDPIDVDAEIGEGFDGRFLKHGTVPKEAGWPGGVLQGGSGGA